MPPFAQAGFERLSHVIGCVHVSGLQVRPDMPAGRYGDTRTWRKSLKRALSSVALVAFPGPDLTDHLTLPPVDPLTRPMFPRAVSDQVAYPALLKKLRHSAGEKRSAIRPMVCHRPSTVRSAALRSRALYLAKACSIGFRSGL